MMELELGLALPNHTPTTKRGFDLNRSSSSSSSSIVLEMENTDQKRGFVDEDESNLCLILGGQPAEKEEAGSGRPPKSRKLHINVDESEDIEGWPPVNSHRHQAAEAERMMIRSSMYVKVKMEGVAIGRKVDLRHYHSYPDLINTLINMFDKYYKEEYSLFYQDKEGDWLQVGDVQWGMFVQSVQRLVILKTNKMGFGSYSQATC